MLHDDCKVMVRGREGLAITFILVTSQVAAVHLTRLNTKRCVSRSKIPHGETSGTTRQVSKAVRGRLESSPNRQPMFIGVSSMHTTRLVGLTHRYRRQAMFRLLAFVLTCSPTLALACGGLFCNNAAPVNQNAERILFASDGDNITMHVQITYAGPPSEFGWLLPVPTDVEYGLSKDVVFSQLDALFGPRFILQRIFPDDCFGDEEVSFAAADDADLATEGASDEPSVNVLSRESLGPYEITLLTADNIQVLRDWLDENEYQIPDNVDETLSPYIEKESAFVALKLLADADSGDITPLRLNFRGDTPAIPIVPTSVAADPDMGIIVHVLGKTRAIPLNYRHVAINEAAIDWLSGGSNYADVVSQAADEAMGQAFTTDYAGLHQSQIRLTTVEAALIAAIEPIRDLRGGWPALQELTTLMQNDADVTRAFTAVISLGDDANVRVEDVVRCPRCVSRRSNIDAAEILIDGAALATKLEAINEIRQDLNELFEQLPYLTRLYGTMSPSEMTLDPTFSFNRDLPPITNIRRATLYTDCDGNGDRIETSSGFVFDSTEADRTIQRQNGETVRGTDTAAAAVITQQMSAGQPEVIVDNRDALREKHGNDTPLTENAMMSGRESSQTNSQPMLAERDGDDEPSSEGSGKNMFGCTTHSSTAMAAESIITAMFAIVVGLRRRRQNNR